MGINYHDIATPLRTQAIMNKYGIDTKKHLGQNFLIDLNILEKIVLAGDVSKNDNVIEIGPGIGSLTEQLARASKEVVAFEIDKQLINVLSDTLSVYNNVRIINQDILKVNLKESISNNFKNPNASLKIIANLPYYITTPILMHILQSGILTKKIVVMMQKEVANRLVAKPGMKEYGSLSLMIQYKLKPYIAFNVDRNSFIPKPNVDSSIVVLEPRIPLEIMPENEQRLFNLFKICFVMRRKTLWNNLITAFGKNCEMKNKLLNALKIIQINPKIRAEMLTLEEFILLQNALTETGCY